MSFYNVTFKYQIFGMICLFYQKYNLCMLCFANHQTIVCVLFLIYLIFILMCMRLQNVFQVNGLLFYVSPLLRYLCFITAVSWNTHTFPSTSIAICAPRRTYLSASVWQQPCLSHCSHVSPCIYYLYNLNTIVCNIINISSLIKPVCKAVNFREWATPQHLICNNRDLWATIYLVLIVKTFFGVFCNMFRYYVIISYFLRIKYYLILKYLINSW